MFASRQDGIVQRFNKAERGATAVMFALLVVPLICVVGVAVDGARWALGRQRTSEAIDAGVLAGARAMQFNAADVDGAKAAALTAYRANMGGRIATYTDTVAFDLADSNTAMTAVGSVTMKTTLMSVAGIPSMNLFKPAKATFATGLNAGTNLEISLVLDFTGSMCDGAQPCSGGTKVQGLRDAAKELIDIVVNDNQSIFTSRVALVPFSERIRVAADVGTGAMMQAMTNLPPTWSGWVSECTDGSGSGASDGGSSTWACNASASVQRNNLRLMPCVTERIYTNHWNANDTMDYTDAAPGAGKWLMAHGGDRAMKFYDSSDSNPLPATDGTSATNPAYQWNYGDGTDCYNVPTSNVIVPLSADKTMLKAKIDGYSAGGATAGPLAHSFGWYMLSPNWSSIWPSTGQPGSYSDLTTRNANGAPMLRKVAVIMTDGVYNTMRGNMLSNNVQVADHARQVCVNMKAAGIEVYTVAFALDQLNGSDRSTAENMLRDCGSSVRHFYSTLNVEDLKLAFRDIALRVTPVRLTQ